MGAPQLGRGAGAEWAVLPQSACGRGRAVTSSRRGVDGGGDDEDVPQSSGWARWRRPGFAEVSVVCGGGPREAAALWRGGRPAQAGEARGGGDHPVRGDLRRGPGVGRLGAGVVPGSAGPRGGARRPSGCRRSGSPRGAAAGRWAPPPGRSTTTLPREPRLRRTRRRRRGRGRPRRMEERKEEGEAEIQEHGPEHWFSKWERQCLAEAEQDEQLPPELQEEAAAAAQPEHKQQKLWHLFQNSATAVAQLYKGEGCCRHLAPSPPPPPPPRARLSGGRRRVRGWRWGWAASEAPAVASRPCRPLPARWRRGRRAVGRRPGGGPGRALGAPALGAARGAPRFWGRAAGRPGPVRGGEGPPVTKWRREAPGRPIVPEPVSGRGLRGGASHRRAWAPAAPRVPRPPLAARRDPLPAGPRPSAGSRKP